MIRRAKQQADHLMSRFSDWLQLDIRYFIGGGFWLSLLTLVRYLMGLFRSLAFARLAEQSTYGQFSFVNGLIGTIGILSLPGLGTALAETVARGNLGSLIDASRARAKWGILSILAAAGVSLYYYIFCEQYELACALLVAGASQPFLSAFQIVESYYNGRRRFDKVSLVTAGATVLNTIALLIALWLRRGLIWLIAAHSGSQVLFYWACYRREAQRTTSHPRDPELVSYGRALTWAQVVLLISARLDSTLLGISTGFVDVAVYTVASVIPTNLKSVMGILMPLSMTKIAERPGVRVYTKRTCRWLLFLLVANVAIVVLAIVAMPYVLSFLYGERYAGSTIYAQLLMLSLIASWPNYFFSAALKARKQIRAIRRFNLIYGILQVGTLLLFVPLWGVLGIVLSRIVTRWGAILYQWHAVTKI